MKKSGLIFLIVSLFLFSNSVQSKILDLIEPYLGNSHIDVLSYDFEIKVEDIAQNSFPVTMTMNLISFKDSQEIELHAESRLMKINEIQVDGVRSSFSFLKGIPNLPEYGLSGDVLQISGLNLKAGQEAQVRISYDVSLSDSKTQTGLFSKDQLGNRVLLTRNWPYYGRYWFPSNDSPLDPAKVSFKIQVPVGYVALANGALKSEQDQIYQWEQSKPTSTYNFIFAITKASVYREDVCFDRTGIDNQRVDCAVAQVKIPLEIYYNPAIPWHLEALQSVKSGVDSVIYFSKLFGDYEFEKLGFLISSYPFSMESTSLIVLNNKVSAIHEIAHHWFGNNVVIPHWGDFWISEGFATYVTGLYDEYTTGKNTSCFDETSPNALNNPPTTDPNAIFDSIPYCKGASAIHSLRTELQILSGQSPLATKAYLKLLSELYLQFRGQALSTEMLIEFTHQKAFAIYKSEGILLPEADLKLVLNEWSQNWFGK